MEITFRDLFRDSAVVVLTGAVGLTLALSASAQSQNHRNPQNRNGGHSERSRAGLEFHGALPATTSVYCLHWRAPRQILRSPGHRAEFSHHRRSLQAVTNPMGDERAKRDPQAAQEEVEQIPRELSYDSKVISDGDVDLADFKSGSSGLASCRGHLRTGFLHLSPVTVGSALRLGHLVSV